MPAPLMQLGCKDRLGRADHDSLPSALKSIARRTETMSKSSSADAKLPGVPRGQDGWVNALFATVCAPFLALTIDVSGV